jgi:hypothetical protein
MSEYYKILYTLFIMLLFREIDYVHYDTRTLECFTRNRLLQLDDFSYRFAYISIFSLTLKLPHTDLKMTINRIDHSNITEILLKVESVVIHHDHKPCYMRYWEEGRVTH